MIHITFVRLLLSMAPAFGFRHDARAATSIHYYPSMDVLPPSLISVFLVSLLLALVARVGFKLVKRANALRQLNGPPCSDPLLGHLKLFLGPVTGMTTQGELLNAYGSVCKLKGPLWEDQLWTSDPRAMHEILVKSHQRFRQPGSIITWINLLIGPNILTVTGHQHQTQRKILNPAFKADHMRNVTPTVTTVAQKLKELLELKIQAQGENVGVLDVYKWLNVAALEVMGQAGFGYSFDALEPNHEDVEYLNASHRIAALMLNLWFITPVLPWLMKIGSRRFRRAIVSRLPFGPIRALRNATDTLNNLAAKVYHIKKEDLDKMMLDSGEHLSRDVMSSLLLQNNIVAPEEAMDEEEVISQVNALFLAAHDSTSAALARTIHVLAEHPDVQSKLRDEVCEAYEMFGEELDYDQLNSLPYLDAVCRESLRLYAPAPFLIRIAQEDWTIPLLYPGKSSDDQETITHVSVKKGTCIHLSLDAANRDVRTWGEDTNVFRPSRWLDSTQTNLQESRMPGIYSPLMTFSGGPRACIGFKFSQLEMKLLLAKLISSFKFELSDTQITWRLDSVPKPYVGSGGDNVATTPSMPMRVTVLGDASYVE